MLDAKPIVTLLPSHMKLSLVDSPTTKEEKSSMDAVPYTSVIGSFIYIYAIVCTRLDIGHAISPFS